MKNWKTTLLGIITGALPIIDAIIAAFHSGQFSGKSALETGMGIVIIALGYLAQDPSVKVFFAQPLVSELAPVAQEVISLESASHPTNILLADIKKALDALVPAAPATTPPATK